jgi:hypothetical protein
METEDAVEGRAGQAEGLLVARAGRGRGAAAAAAPAGTPEVTMVPMTPEQTNKDSVMPIAAVTPDASRQRQPQAQLWCG